MTPPRNRKEILKEADSRVNEGGATTLVHLISTLLSCVARTARHGAVPWKTDDRLPDGAGD